MGTGWVIDYNDLHNFKPMRKPENVNKLNIDKFWCNGNVYQISLHTNIGNYTSFFIFDESKNLMSSHCCFIEIDWDSNSFDIKKCVLGEGTNGVKLKTQFFKKEFVRTMDEFVGFVMRCVLDEIENGNFK